MRRYLLISVLIFVVLAATATGIGWYLLHDESFLKSHLRTFVLRQTGRELTIDGPLRLSLGRVTTLDASGIHFADADWTDQPDMVAIGHLAVAVRVASLFEDKPVLPSLALEDCVVFLVKNESGEANWDILPHSEPEPTPEKQPQKGLPVWIKNIAVHNCRLKMSGPRLEKTLDIKITGLSTQHLEDDRLAARGTGSVNDEALSFDGWAAPLSSVFFGGPL